MTDSDLLYSAGARCICGAGLAYKMLSDHPPPPDEVWPVAWTCSLVLKGEAEPKGHDSFPFAFYKIREETSINNTSGITTRPKGTVAKTVGKATCPKCHHVWQSEPYVACGLSHHWFSGPCPGCGYSVGSDGKYRSQDGPAIECRFRDVVQADAGEK